MAKILKGLSIPYHPKAKAVQTTPLARTRKGMAGITPVGVTGHQNTTKEGMDGRVKGGMPKMRPGGKSRGHKVPISFDKYPEMKSARMAQGMGTLGAHHGGMVGINPPFKEGSVAGKKAKNQRSTKSY